MHEFDDAVLMCFLKKQSQLFPEEDVASNLEEAEAFLEECMAVVVESAEEVKEYFAGNLCRCTGYMGQLRAIKKYLEMKRGTK